MSEDDALRKYHELIDGLVRRRDGVLPDWVRLKGWPMLPKNEQLNAFLSRLTAMERESVARVVQEARDGGIHDTLAFFQERMDAGNLRFVVDGEEIPVSPHDTGLFWDWTARANGKPWPKSGEREP